MAIDGHINDIVSIRQRPATVEDRALPRRTLRICCTEFLGMSSTRYYLIRRLNMVRLALQRADPAVANVGEIARGHEFLELGRFAAAYRAAFGETPSFTLRSPRIKPT